MKKIIFCVLAFIFGSHVYAQDETTSSSQFNYLGGQTETIAKQGTVRNDLSTGRVAVSNNLLSKKIGGLDIGVGISYSGGGIRVLDQPSATGLGWNLTAGGAIVRHRRGVPDDFKNKDETLSLAQELNGILYSVPLKQTDDGVSRVSSSDPAYWYAQGIADGQHDIFSFSFLGLSGQFYVGKDKSIQLVGCHDITITPRFGELSDIYSTIMAFEVVDNKGIRYFFEEIETMRDDGSVNPALAPECYRHKNYISAWYLTKIEFPEGDSKVEFLYNSKAYNDVSTRLFREVFTESSNKPGMGRVNYFSVFDNNIRKKVSLDEIIFSDSSRISFGYSDYPYGSPMLESVSLKEANKNVLSYGFTYQWWDIEDEQMYYSSLEFDELHSNGWYLESIDLLSADGGKKPYCSFGYFLGTNANGSDIQEKKGVDYWGFYNGADNNRNLIPHELRMTDLYNTGWSILPPANRNAVLNPAQIGVLKEIYFYTGGRESIEYELNDRTNNGIKEVVGGLRVKQILSYGDDNKLEKTRQYKYIKSDGNSSGFLGDKGEYKFLENLYYDDGGWPSNPTLKATKTTLMSHAINDVSSVNGSHIAYSRVEEHIYSEGSLYKGKTVYEFSGLDSVKYSLWAPQDYYPYRPVDKPTWAVGLPISESVYDNNNVPVKQTTRKYTIVQGTQVNENLRSLYVSSIGEVDVHNGGGSGSRFLYKHKNYYPVIGYSLVSEIDESEIHNGVTQTKKQIFTYAPGRSLLKTITVSSGGQDKQMRYYYPFEYSASISTALADMVTKNRVDYPILTEEWRGSAGGNYMLSSAALNTYRVESGYMRADKSYVAELTNLIPMSSAGLFSSTVLIPAAYNFKQVKQFVKYGENGELLQLDNASGNRRSFVYNRYGAPIVMADNAGYNSLRYYGFEPYEKPYSNGSLIGQVKSGSTHMGEYCFTGTVSFTSFPLGNYVVECFAKGAGSVTANGVGSTLGSEWKNIRWVFQNITSISLVANSSSLIDEVRIYPVGGMIGVTATDVLGNGISNVKPNGIGHFTAYDAYKRVKEVSDEAGNILEAFDYHEKPPYMSATKSHQYTSYACPSGYVPSGPVTYTVPAGTYSSLISQTVADQKAELAARFNGQAYANTHATCIKGYWNVELIKYYTRNNCTINTSPETVAYRVAEGKYLSTISQVDADSKALQEANQNGQAYANENGDCLQYVRLAFSNETDQTFEVIYSGPDGNEVVKELPAAADSQAAPVLQGNIYTFYIRPKGGENPNQVFEFSYNEDMQQVGPAATYEITVNGGSLLFTIKPVQ